MDVWQSKETRARVSGEIENKAHDSCPQTLEEIDFGPWHGWRELSFE